MRRLLLLEVFIILTIKGICLTADCGRLEPTRIKRQALHPGNKRLAADVVKDLEPICKDMNSTVLIGYAPNNRRSPGTRHRLKEGDDSIEACTRACCSRNKCIIAYRASGECVELLCDDGYAECAPTSIGDDENEMVQVRDPPTAEIKCTLGRGKAQCGWNEMCVSTGKSSEKGVCQCPEYFHIDADGDCINPEDAENEAGEINKPPIANATGHHIMAGSSAIVIFNGSLSTDDGDSLSYKWDRKSESAAAGSTVPNSDTSPILMLVNVPPGTYVFELTVTDILGLTAHASATVIVPGDPLKEYSLRVVVGIPVANLTKERMDEMQKTLSEQFHGTVFEVRQIESDLRTGNTAIEFLVHETDGAQKPRVSLSDLRSKLERVNSSLPFPVVSSDQAAEHLRQPWPSKPVAYGPQDTVSWLSHIGVLLIGMIIGAIGLHCWCSRRHLNGYRRTASSPTASLANCHYTSCPSTNCPS